VLHDKQVSSLLVWLWAYNNAIIPFFLYNWNTIFKSRSSPWW